MAHRHKMLKRGGRASGGAHTHDVYSGASSDVVKEARGTGRGWKHGGKVHGDGIKARLDKRARGGGVGKSPFSSAAHMQDMKRTPHTKDHAQPRADGGRTHKKHGGEVMKAVGASHRRKRKHGGKCDGDDDEDDHRYAKGGRYAAGETDDDDDEGGGDRPAESETMKGLKSGAKELALTAAHVAGDALGTAAKTGLLGGAKRGGRRASGGRAPHIDIYETKGGTHHWVDKAAKGGGKWIQGAIKHKGALHKELGVPQGEKIPAKKLSKAEHSSNPKLAKRARLAQTLKGFHH